MIAARRLQRDFADGFVAEAVEDLWEPWMRQADRILDDEPLIQAVQEALLKRRPKSRTRGRRGYPAEIVLRMLLLKHIRNWSFGQLEREVRPNLVYREFTRIGSGKVPDAKALGRQASSGPQSGRADPSARGGTGGGAQGGTGLQDEGGYDGL